MAEGNKAGFDVAPDSFFDTIAVARALWRRTPWGLVVGGALSAGLDVKLGTPPDVFMEGLAVGKYVVIRGQQTGQQFFGLITDIGLDAARDPARLRHLRGAEEVARLVVAP